MASALRQTDLRAVMDAALRVHAVRHLDEFGPTAVAALRELIPGTGHGFNLVDDVSGLVLASTDPEECSDPGLIQHFLQNLAQHPVYLQILRTGTTDALAISDFLSTERFARTALYADYYREIDAEDQLSVASKRPGFMLAFVVNRDRRTFTARDRSKLELLRPHLEQAYLHVVQMELLRTGATHGSHAMLALTTGGRIQSVVDERGDQLLDNFLSVGSERAHLTEPLKSWLARCKIACNPGDDALAAPEPPLVLQNGWQRLEIRYVPGIQTDQALLLLRAWTSPAAPERLRHFGLPPRHTETLSLLAQGLSDHEIAERLGVAHRTVTSLLREIYHRLGVSNRTAAIALVFENA